MKLYEANNYQTAQDALESNKCPNGYENTMHEKCLTWGCLAHWEEEVEE